MFKGPLDIRRIRLHWSSRAGAMRKSLGHMLELLPLFLAQCLPRPVFSRSGPWRSFAMTAALVRPTEHKSSTHTRCSESKVPSASPSHNWAAQLRAEPQHRQSPSSRMFCVLATRFNTQPPSATPKSESTTDTLTKRNALRHASVEDNARPPYQSKIGHCGAQRMHHYCRLAPHEDRAETSDDCRTLELLELGTWFYRIINGNGTDRYSEDDGNDGRRTARNDERRTMPGRAQRLVSTKVRMPPLRRGHSKGQIEEHVATYGPFVGEGGRDGSY